VGGALPGRCLRIRAIRSTLVLAGLGALLAGASADADAAGRGRPLRGRADLSAPEGGDQGNDRGRCETRFFPAVGSRLERSWFRLKLRHLEGGRTYGLFVDDPSTADDDGTLTSFGTLTTNAGGNAFLRIDTKKGDGLPLGAALADLGGKTLEVRDDAGTVILAGAVPAVQ
jgi:hypothetical protein